MTENLGPIDPDAFYTLKEVRNYLRISDATARRWVKEGRLRVARTVELLQGAVEAGGT